MYKETNTLNSLFFLIVMKTFKYIVKYMFCLGDLRPSQHSTFTFIEALSSGMFEETIDLRQAH